MFTVSPKLADLVPGPRPDPELARYDRITAQRAGEPPAAAAGTRGAHAVLAGVLQRDGQQLSASQIRQQALAHADHLALLHAIWTDQTTAAREQRYRDLLMSVLPPELGSISGGRICCRAFESGRIVIDALWIVPHTCHTIVRCLVRLAEFGSRPSRHRVDVVGVPDTVVVPVVVMAETRQQAIEKASAKLPRVLGLGVPR